MLGCISPGLLATLQDTGRRGWQALGIGTAGAMDLFAARVANALLANADDAPVLEITLGGAEFVALADGWYALCGADLEATLDGAELPLCAPFRLANGQRLRLARARRGCRAYLATTGGFAADRVFGSAATDLRAGLGGLHGRALQRGDELKAQAHREPVRLPRRVFTSLAHPAVVPEQPLGLIAGPALHAISTADRAQILGQHFTVSRASDRMGLRLEEALSSAVGLPQSLSAAVVFGTVQMPPDGKAIILGADRQTTGGYPVVGVVASVDHARVAQIRPGERLRFQVMDVIEARAALLSRERQFAQLRIAAAAWWREE